MATTKASARKKSGSKLAGRKKGTDCAQQTAAVNISGATVSIRFVLTTMAYSHIHLRTQAAPAAGLVSASGSVAAPVTNVSPIEPTAEASANDNTGVLVAPQIMTGSAVSSSDVLSTTLNSQRAMSNVMAPTNNDMDVGHLPSASSAAQPPTAPASGTSQTVVSEAVIDPQLRGVIVPGPQSPQPLDTLLNTVQSLRGMAIYPSKL